MKKTLSIILVFSLFIMSCSNDDDSNSMQDDPIIGTWKYYKFFYNGEEQALEVCDNEETLKFFGDGSFSQEFFEDIGDDCISEGAELGSWSTDGNNNYTIIVDGESETDLVTFEGNTYYYEFTDNDGMMDFTERDVYIKQ